VGSTFIVPHPFLFTLVIGVGMEKQLLEENKYFLLDAVKCQIFQEGMDFCA